MDTVENAKKRAEYWKAEHLAANAEIERLRLWLEQIRVLMAGAYGNSSFHPRVAKMAARALAGDAPNGPDVRRGVAWARGAEERLSVHRAGLGDRAPGRDDCELLHGRAWAAFDRECE